MISSSAEHAAVCADHHLLTVSHLLFVNTSGLVLLMLVAPWKTSSIFLCLHAASKQQEIRPAWGSYAVTEYRSFSCWRSPSVTLSREKQLWPKLYGTAARVHTAFLFRWSRLWGATRRERPKEGAGLSMCEKGQKADEEPGRRCAD